MNYATKVMLGENKIDDFDYTSHLKGFAIKQPVFSFNKFPSVNKALGPEMKSTGESILFIDNLNSLKNLIIYFLMMRILPCFQDLFCKQ